MIGLMTAEQLAETLAVSPATIREWARQKIIPAVHVSPRVIRFDWNAVLRELAKRQTGIGENTGISKNRPRKAALRNSKTGQDPISNSVPISLSSRPQRTSKLYRPVDPTFPDIKAYDGTKYST